MSYPEESASIFPGVVILLAMAGLVAVQVNIKRATASVRVWVPAKSSQALPAGRRGIVLPYRLDAAVRTKSNRVQRAETHVSELQQLRDAAVA